MQGLGPNNLKGPPFTTHKFSGAPLPVLRTIDPFAPVDGPAHDRKRKKGNEKLSHGRLGAHGETNRELAQDKYFMSVRMSVC